MISVSGQFRVEKRRGSIITEARTFPNLVMSQAFDNLMDLLRSSSAWQVARYVFLGTGDSEPTLDDPGLEERSSLPGVEASSQTYSNWNDGPSGSRWSDVTLRFDYAEGEATGEWTEIGAAANADYSEPYNRSLILDENHAPTSLIVMSDESLTVYLTLRLQEGLRFPRRGVTHYQGEEIGFTLTPRPARVFTLNTFNAWNNGWAHRHVTVLDEGGGSLSFTTPPWPAEPENASASPSVSLSYDAPSRTLTADVSIRDSSVDLSIGGLAFGTSSNSADRIYELMFDQPLIKPYDNTLTFQTSITFTRA